MIGSALNLGTMEKLVARPLPEFDGFLKQQRIDVARLRNILPEIKDKRNQAVHEGMPSLREDVSDVSVVGLGKGMVRRASSRQ